MATAPALFFIFLSRRFSSLLGDLRVHVYAFAFERLEFEVRLLTALVTVDTAISIGLVAHGYSSFTQAKRSSSSIKPFSTERDAAFVGKQCGRKSWGASTRKTAKAE
ncbi:hypothetical protein C8J56DRAFT_946450, partial [Mycena floridula]